MPSDIERIALAVTRAIDREQKRRPAESTVIVAALGAAAAAVTAVSYGPNGGVADQVVMGCLGMGYNEALKAIREREAN